MDENDRELLEALKAGPLPEDDLADRLGCSVDEALNRLSLCASRGHVLLGDFGASSASVWNLTVKGRKALSDSRPAD